jgi:NADH dehydrogenase
MQQSRIVVLGGGYSGIMAAGRLAIKLHGKPVEITLVNAAPDFVQRIRFHQLAANQSPAKIPLGKLLKASGIKFIQAKVTQINPQSHSLTLQNADGTTQPLVYDYLIYALGSYVDTSRVPGVQEYALSLGSETTAIQLRDQMPAIADRQGHLIVIGGGFTGIEAATEFAETYPSLKVTLITSDSFGAKVSKHGRQYLKKVFDRLHINVIDNATVQRITPDELRFEGGAIPYDACLWLGGFAVPELARQSGLKVNDVGQIAIDDHLCSLSHPDIYAVGDAADVATATGTPTRMACANALPMGAYVADELAARINGVTHRPHEIADFYRCMSLGRNAALLQTYDTDDMPKETILTGRVAAAVKEMICRYTVWQVNNPRWMYFQHRPKSEHVDQASKAVAQSS